jgi:hypothetical protein
MSSYFETIVDAQTGDITTRAFTDAEIKKAKAAIAEAEKRTEQSIAQEAARQAVLDKLGLSADELKALLS